MGEQWLGVIKLSQILLQFCDKAATGCVAANSEIAPVPGAIALAIVSEGSSKVQRMTRPEDSTCATNAWVPEDLAIRYAPGVTGKAAEFTYPVTHAVLLPFGRIAVPPSSALLPPKTMDIRTVPA